MLQIIGLFSQRFNIQVLVWLRTTTALYVIFNVSQMYNYISCCTFRTHQRRPLKHVLYYSWGYGEKAILIKNFNPLQLRKYTAWQGTELSVLDTLRCMSIFVFVFIQKTLGILSESFALPWFGVAEV